MITARRRARELAVQVLYALDTNPDQQPEAALALHLDRFVPPDEPGEEPPTGEPPLDRAFAQALVLGVARHRAELDEIIARVSRTWRVERMARLDRAILRLAAFELGHGSEVPARVVLDEAIELAKRYGSAEAPAFVNGILDSVLTALGVDAK